jgi:hypothetical protein
MLTRPSSPPSLAVSLKDDAAGSRYSCRHTNLERTDVFGVITVGVETRTHTHNIPSLIYHSCLVNSMSISSRKFGKCVCYMHWVMKSDNYNK